jgi:hypothetical protein
MEHVLKSGNRVSQEILVRGALELPVKHSSTSTTNAGDRSSALSMPCPAWSRSLPAHVRACEGAGEINLPQGEPALPPAGAAAQVVPSRSPLSAAPKAGALSAWSGQQPFGARDAAHRQPTGRAKASSAPADSTH